MDTEFRHQSPGGDSVHPFDGFQTLQDVFKRCHPFDDFLLSADHLVFQLSQILQQLPQQESMMLLQVSV